MSVVRVLPGEFTWNELKRLLPGFGLPGGGRERIAESVRARSNGVSISLHQPHPRSTLKAYQVRDVLDHLKQEGYL